MYLKNLKKRWKIKVDFDSIYDLNTNMYRSGVTYYDSNRDIYIVKILRKHRI